MPGDGSAREPLHAPRDAYDPAVQPERTRLAWWRTGLAFTVVVLLAWRAPVMSDDPLPGAIAAGLLTLAWLGFLALLRPRTRQLRQRLPPPLAHGTVLGTGAAATSGAALVLLLLR